MPRLHWPAGLLCLYEPVIATGPFATAAVMSLDAEPVVRTSKEWSTISLPPTRCCNFRQQPFRGAHHRCSWPDKRTTAFRSPRARQSSTSAPAEAPKSKSRSSVVRSSLALRMSVVLLPSRPTRYCNFRQQPFRGARHCCSWPDKRTTVFRSTHRREQRRPLSDASSDRAAYRFGNYRCSELDHGANQPE
jgi:hypothetical protein